MGEASLEAYASSQRSASEAYDRTGERMHLVATDFFAGSNAISVIRKC